MIWSGWLKKYPWKQILVEIINIDAISKQNGTKIEIFDN